MKIKHVNRSVFDVFVGDGWENWTRFEIIKAKGRKFIKKLAGQSVPNEEMDTIRNIYLKGN